MRHLISIAIVALTICVAPAVGAQLASSVPWAVPTDNPVEQRQILLTNSGARLSGTLYLPKGTTPRAALIALHGAQVPLRTAPLYRHLIQTMPRLGIAVFIYDRRGSGASTSGGAAPGNFDLLADAHGHDRCRMGIDVEVKLPLQNLSHLTTYSDRLI